MKRIFVKNLLLLQSLNLVVKPVWLLIVDRMAQNLLGTEVYGEYYIVLNLTLVLNIFLDLGIQNFNNTSVAADANFFKRNFGAIFLLKSVLASLYLITVLIIGIRSGMPFDLLLVLVLNQILTTFILYLRTNINGLHHYTTDSLLSVSDKFFAILFCAYLFYTGRVSIMNFILAQFAASCITFLTAGTINLVLWKRVQGNEGDNRDNLKLLIRQSLPYALLFTLMNFYTRMDVSMMNYLLPDAVHHSGVYAQSFRFLDAAAMFAMLFAGLLLPMFAKMIGRKEDVRPLAGMAATILLLISLTVAMASSLYGERILKAMYHYNDISQLLESGAVFRNIMLTFVPMSMTFVFSTLLTAGKDIRHMNIYAAAAFVCNFTVNLLLIPEYKSLGASVGSLITQTLFAVLCIYRCYRLFTFGIPWKMAGRFAVWAVSLYGLYFLISATGNIWLVLGLFSVGAASLALLIGIVSLRQLMVIFRKEPQ